MTKKKKFLNLCFYKQNYIKVVQGVHEIQYRSTIIRYIKTSNWICPPIGKTEFLLLSSLEMNQDQDRRLTL